MTPDDAAEPISETFRILFLGDVVGEPGRKAVTTLLPLLKEELQVDLKKDGGLHPADLMAHQEI